MTKSSLLEARVLALVWVFAAVMVARADGALHGGADACFATAPTTVGAVMRIFHTSLYVRGRYVGAAPCDLVARDTLSTDTRGEALFQLSVRGRTTQCVVFPLAKLRVFPDGERTTPRTSLAVATFSVGRTWCSAVGGVTPAHVAAGVATVPLVNAIFSVEVASGTGTVLVKAGAGSLTVQAFGDSRRVKQGYAVLVFQNGTIKGPQRARFDAKDGLALARLR